MNNMKAILVFFLTAFSLTVFSQSTADRILGYYYFKDPEDNGGVQALIYKNAEGKYDGKIVWTEKPNNSIDYVFLKDFVYNSSKDEWEQGFMYDPVTDRRYRGNIKFEGQNRLRVRGFLGISLIGQTMYWTKETAARR